jgi:chromosomal replication initiator protein
VQTGPSEAARLRSARLACTPVAGAVRGYCLPIDTAMNAWQEVLNYLKSKVNPQSYQTWLKPTRYSHSEAETLVVRVPNHEFQEWIQEHYSNGIQEALEKLRLGFSGIRYELEMQPEKKSSGNGEVKPRQGKLDFESVANQLNARYTFDTFVVGSCNQFAHAAARAVAETPAKAYNPLFLYGGVGLGKTHLMQAVGHMMKERQRELRLAYVSSEAFTNDVINSLRYDRMVSFRDKYRNVDVLLMDDIQFIGGKERTQEEFFHTFNTLYEAQKQVVISSDQPPKDIRGLEERLRSRFGWGLTADLQPPDTETKRAILDKKSEDQGVKLPEAVGEFIAARIKTSIRDLEGALTRLIAYSSLTGAEISLPMAQQVLKNIIDLEQRRVSIEHIQRLVCQEYGLSLTQLKARDNSHAIAFPRQVAMYLSKELTPASLPQIGREFGGKHHTTVLHSIQKVERLRKTDRDLNRLLNRLRDTLS